MQAPGACVQGEVPGSCKSGASHTGRVEEQDKVQEAGQLPRRGAVSIRPSVFPGHRKQQLQGMKGGLGVGIAEEGFSWFEEEPSQKGSPQR